MKKTKLKILFTSLSFFALSATFGQVDTSGGVTKTPTDSTVQVPQGSPVATDSTSAGYDKADKKRLKATKKEMKAEKKEAGK